MRVPLGVRRPFESGKTLVANISITSLCNRSCAYCFAPKSAGSETTLGPHMNMALFSRALDFLERSRIDQARLLGGEPTLHPEFESFIGAALDRGLKLLLFSNGHMPDKALDCLTAVPAERLTLLVNLSAGKQSNCWGVSDRQKRVFEQLGGQTMVGVNIYRPDARLDGLLDVIATYQLRPAIRIGMAHPCIPQHNLYLYPHEYELVGRHLFVFGQEAAAQGVSIEFDCGFVPCMFPQDLFKVFKKSEAELGQRCSPIIDILPDGTVASCFPLADHVRIPLQDHHDADLLRSTFERELRPYQGIGIFRDCCACELFSKRRCRGGCLAAAMTRLRQAPDGIAAMQPDRQVDYRHDPKAHVLHSPERSVSTPSPNKEETHTGWVLPYIDQPPEFWQQLADAHGKRIREVYFPLPIDALGSGRPPQPQKHLSAFLASKLLNAAVLINPLVLPAPVDTLISAIVNALQALMDQYQIVGATVANIDLGRHLRARFPGLKLTASVLMDIHTPLQVAMMEGVFDQLVPSGRIVRDLDVLKRLREAFDGKIRLMVNEACLPGCPHRNQHFFEMGNGITHPASLCNRLLASKPWLRLTGSWVLPQHLHLYEGLFDELKLAGRVTLKHPDQYRRVVRAYMNRRALTPDEIGGGPASVLEPIEIEEAFFLQTLTCGHRCHQCDRCQDYYMAASHHGT